MWTAVGLIILALIVYGGYRLVHRLLTEDMRETGDSPGGPVVRDRNDKV